MESFQLLAKQYQPMIHKIINSLHIYKNKDEFYQQGLIALWEAARRFDPQKGDFSNYAYTYIRGYLLTELKKQARDGERSLYPKEEFWETVEDRFPACPLEEENLLSYCRALTANQKKWVLYTALHDLSIKEIADRENVSVSAVKQWRSGAKEKIKALADL